VIPCYEGFSKAQSIFLKNIAKKKLLHFMDTVLYFWSLDNIFPPDVFVSAEKIIQSFYLGTLPCSETFSKLNTVEEVYGNMHVE
jgi:hypothetical protein